VDVNQNTLRKIKHFLSLASFFFYSLGSYIFKVQQANQISCGSYHGFACWYPYELVTHTTNNVIYHWFGVKFVGV